jgi:hypothetical protein
VRATAADPEFSIGSLLYLRACFNERLQQQPQLPRQPQVMHVSYRRPSHDAPTTPPAPPPQELAVAMRTTRSPSRTLDKLLSSHRRRVGGECRATKDR